MLLFLDVSILGSLSFLCSEQWGLCLLTQSTLPLVSCLLLSVVWFSIGHLSNQYTETLSRSMRVHAPFLVWQHEDSYDVPTFCLPPLPVSSSHICPRGTFILMYSRLRPFRCCSANINLSLSYFIQRLTLLLKINSHYD